MTRTQAEQALIKAAIKYTSWHEAVGYRFRIFQVPADFDCESLPGDFEVIFTIGDTCIVREQIDDYPDITGMLFGPNKTKLS